MVALRGDSDHQPVAARPLGRLLRQADRARRWLPGYAAIASNRGYLWAFFLIAGVQLIVGACAVALATWLLAPVRGARWATAGGSIAWLGAASYGVGIGGSAALYYFGTDPATLDPATPAGLIDRERRAARHRRRNRGRGRSAATSSHERRERRRRALDQRMRRRRAVSGEHWEAPRDGSHRFDHAGRR